MDHKKFFATFARKDISTHVDGLTAFTVEELYQAFKQRLIKEVVAQVKLPYHIDRFASFIDTTGQADEG